MIFLLGGTQGKSSSTKDKPRRKDQGTPKRAGNVLEIDEPIKPSKHIRDD